MYTKLQAEPVDMLVTEILPGLEMVRSMKSMTYLYAMDEWSRSTQEIKSWTFVLPFYAVAYLWVGNNVHLYGEGIEWVIPMPFNPGLWTPSLDVEDGRYVEFRIRRQV